MKKKILFWISPDISFFCLAHFIQQKIDADLFAVIDITEKPKKFFQSQKLVKFQKFWFFHDNIKKEKFNNPDENYLKNFENKYQIDLWKLILNERIYNFYDFHKFSKNEILSIAEQSCKLFEQILIETKPDYVIMHDSRFHHLEIFYQLCKKFKIKIIMPSFPNVGYRAILSENYNRPDNFDELPSSPSQNRDFTQLQKYVNDLNLSKQQNEFNKNLNTGTNAILKAGIEFFLYSNNSNEKTHYNYFGRTKSNVFLFTIKSKLELFFRSRYIDQNLKTEIPKNQPFVYFPLGVDMERNILIQSPLITNQLEILRQISKSIPVNYKIFVKDNPSQILRQWRSKKEYEEIMKIPNVELFHHNTSNVELIKNSDLVCTIGGTSGFEAAVYEKPSIIFSDLYYSVLPSVFYVNDIANLPEIIKKALKTKVNPSDVDQYLTFFHNNSFEFDVNSIGNKILEYFYYNGNLVDVDITEEQILKFMDDCKNDLTLLGNEYLKKLN